MHCGLIQVALLICFGDFNKIFASLEYSQESLRVMYTFRFYRGFNKAEYKQPFTYTLRV